MEEMKRTLRRYESSYVRVSAKKGRFVMHKIQAEHKLYVDGIMTEIHYSTNPYGDPEIIKDIYEDWYYIREDLMGKIEGFRHADAESFLKLDFPKKRRRWTIRIADYYGYDAQSDILLEEMSELQKEILKKRRGADNRKEIVNEIADVQIMLNQMIHLLNITDDEMAVTTRNKLSRQLKRIRKENREKRK